MDKFNLEINAGLNEELSQSNFNEVFDVIQYSGYNQNFIGVYNPYKQFGEAFTLEDITPKPRENNSNAKKLVKLLKKWDSDLDGYISMKELLEDYGYSAENIWDYYFKDEISSDEMEIQDFMTSSDITFDYPYEKFITKGYSQGDYGEVYVDRAKYEEVFGTELDEEAFQEEIDHLFWDMPITGGATLSFKYYQNCVTYTVEVEFEHIDEILKSQYDTDLNIDAIVQVVKAQYPNLPERELVLLKDRLNKVEISVSQHCSCSSELLVT